MPFRAGSRLPHLLLLLLLLFTAGSAQAGEAVVKAALEPEVIGLDETATFTIEVSSSGLGRLRFRPEFELENLELASGPSQSEDIRWVNGSLSTSFRVSWRFRPLATGKARVRSVVLYLRNETIKLRDREISVQQEPTGLEAEPQEGDMADPFAQLFGLRPPWQRRPRQPAVFLRATVEPEHPFAGQQAVYTVALYTKDDVTAIQPRNLPAFRGFWVRDIPQPQHLPTEMVDVGGARFGRVVLLQKALFPLRPGAHVLEPCEMDVMARVFEPRFFGPPLSRQEQARLRTAPLTVAVQPLPAAPPGFAGAVGQMALSAKLDPAQVRMGEAATLTVMLAGRGNLQGVAEPRIAAPPGLTISPPQQQGNERLAGLTLQGSRTWTYAVVPERAGRYQLELTPVSYFDPQSRQFRAAATPPLEIRALPSLSAAAAHRDVPRSGRTAVQASRLAALPWDRMLPWFLTLLTGSLLVAVLVRHRRQGEIAVPAACSNAQHGIEQGLREVESETHPRRAATRLEEIWRCHLATRWDIPAGTPSPRWRGLLEVRGVEPAAAEELTRLAEDLHYLRYAPQLSATNGLISEAISRSRRLLRQLG